MSKVVNIGILIRNEHGDTFPVALNPQMVGVIQNLLMQVPVMESKIVDPSGAKVASKTSIPIIPREVVFDWDAAYSPMDRNLEIELMKKLNERYAAMAEADLTDGKISTEIEGSEGKDGKKKLFTDPQNPFNVELKATGKANEGMTDEEVKAATDKANKKYPEKTEVSDKDLIAKAKYPEKDGQKRQDVTVTPPPLSLSGEAPNPGGE